MCFVNETIVDCTARRMSLASFSPSSDPHRLFIDRYYDELLARGIQYFLPLSELTMVGRTEDGKPEFHSNLRNGGADLEWLGAKYSLTNQGKEFTEHEQRLLKGIGKVLATRYQLLFNAEVVARSSEIFNGLPEDHYVSGFLDPYVFAGAATLAKVTDRVSEAIEVLRISALSTYEDRRISTGALLFGFQPDACHELPAQPSGALHYSSELTAIRSFHRICDGLRTVALVDREGLMVELVDVAEWAAPFADRDLPVPSARRYAAHNRATLCGGHVCLVLTPNGEIKIFADGAQVFSFLDGRWHLTDAVEKYRVWEDALGNKELAHRLFSAALNLAEARRGGLFVILDDRRKARELLNSRDLLHQRNEPAKAGSKNQLHYLLRSQRVTELSQRVLETIARIDGSIVLDREGHLMAFGAVLRHSSAALVPDEIAEGSRTAAAIAASQLGNVLKVSEDGRLSFYKSGHCVWEI
jgi:hypothetical protein